MAIAALFLISSLAVASPSAARATGPSNRAPPAELAATDDSLRTDGSAHDRPDSPENGTEPAPMGLADLGQSGSPFGAVLRTDSFRATAAIGNVSTFNASLGSSATQFSIQLNAFVQFDNGATQYVYWVQDVAEIDSASRDVSYLDNVWNASSVSIASTALTGNGSVSGSGSSSYYGYAPSCTLTTCFVLTNPGSIALALNASTTGGVPTVRFEYGTGGGFVTYDTVEFPWATDVAGFAGFEVNSGLWNGDDCLRCYGDVEWVLGGPGNGYQTNLDGATGIQLALDWWTGSNYAAIPAAVDYGISTAEGIGQVTDDPVAGPGGDPQANLSWGGGALHTLWTSSAVAILDVSDRTTTSTGTYTVNGTTDGFVQSSFAVVLRPGAWPVTVTCNGSTYPLGTLLLIAGEILELEVGAPPVVFEPRGLPALTVWSVMILGVEISGTGNLTFGEPAGTYEYSVPSVAGYTASPSSGNVTVGPHGTNLTIDFSATPSTLSDLERLLTAWLPVILLGVVVVAIAAVGLAVARRHRQRVSASRPIRPAAPILGVCPHCGAAMPPGPAPCARCGWRSP